MAYDDFQIKAEHQLVERLAMTSYGFSNKDLKMYHANFHKQIKLFL